MIIILHLIWGFVVLFLGMLLFAVVVELWWLALLLWIAIAWRRRHRRRKFRQELEKRLKLCYSGSR